jgi:purine nucleoside phosphorylase
MRKVGGLVSFSLSDQASLRLIKALAVERITVMNAVQATNQEFGPDPVYKIDSLRD